MRLTRLDKIALTLAATLAALILIAVQVGNPFGLQVFLPEREIGIWGPLTVEFSAPVRAEAAQIGTAIQPTVPGVWVVAAPNRLDFHPAAPLEAGINYQVVIQPAELGQGGEKLQNTAQLAFSVRSPAILYMPNGEGAREIWRVQQSGEYTVQLTHSGGLVFDFHARRDGSAIAYSARNEGGGFDLWTIDRSGENAQRLLDCGLDRCTNPRWSPDGRLLAYTRENVGPNGSGLGAPRAWVIDLQANQTRQVYSDSQIIGYGPSWSPDGSRLAIYDAVTDGVRVLELASGQETILPTATGQFGGWSPDGSQMFYTAIEDEGQGPRSVVKLANFATGEVTTLLSSGTFDAFYNVPAWAPDGRYIALGMRPEDGKTASSIWIVTLAMLGGPMIPGQPDATDGFYSWDAAGTKLVFQRTPLKGQYQPAILLYDMDTGLVQPLVSNAAWPQWIP